MDVFDHFRPYWTLPHNVGALWRDQFAIASSLVLLLLLLVVSFVAFSGRAKPLYQLVRSHRVALVALIGFGLASWLSLELVWMAQRPSSPVPALAVKQDTFIGEPLLLNWEYDRSALDGGNSGSPTPLVFEVESAGDDLFSSDLRRYPLSEGYYRIFRHVNASRFWRVRTINKQTYRPLSDWSRGVRTTQYDSAYHRIIATREVLVFVSHSEYEDMFKWIDRKSQGFKPKGFEINFAKVIVEELGNRLGHHLEPRFTAVSWPELLNTPAQGRADMIIGAITKRRQRERDFRISFTETYFCTVQSLIYRSGQPPRPVRDLIKGRRVGFQRNTTSEQLIMELAKDTAFEQQPFDRPELLIQAIIDQSLDFGVTDTPFAAVQAFANRLNSGTTLDHQDFNKADFPSSIPEDQQVEEYAIAVRSGDGDLLREINAIVSKMKAEGNLSGLLRQANQEYQESNGFSSDTLGSEMGERPWECPR